MSDQKPIKVQQLQIEFSNVDSIVPKVIVVNEKKETKIIYLDYRKEIYKKILNRVSR